MKIIEDSWLSSILQLPVAKIESGETFDGGLLNRYIKQHPRSFLYSKVPTNYVSIVNTLEIFGFRSVDVSVIFERNTKTLHETNASNVNIKPFSPQWSDDVLKIAQSSFTFSRFHLDPQISNELANTIKREWIRNYVNGARGDQLWVALVQGTPAGFLAALVTHDEPHAVIDLIAVDPRFQGQGVGSALVDVFSKHYKSKCSKLIVGTQVANIPSVRLYTKQGFLLQSSHYVLHMHPGAQ